MTENNGLMLPVIALDSADEAAVRRSGHAPNHDNKEHPHGY